MNAPLDLFEGLLGDAYHILRLESNVPESADEKFNRMARERLGGGQSPWWSE